MKNTKQFIALFYVALILLFKVAALHALTHHTDDNDVKHCEVCHITTAVGFIPLLETDQKKLPQRAHFFSKKELVAIAPFVVYNNKHLSSYLFTRPPPATV
ncbi:hypothetical protein ACNR9Q_12240 [Maribacter sp. X9]|uniref:hypothetical protein n=1 Tax=Maribacter sp. X9 TaxID=3402159 RepID=UPI003AF3CCB3